MLSPRNAIKPYILEIIQQHKLGHIPEKQALNELCDLFSGLWSIQPLKQD